MHDQKFVSLADFKMLDGSTGGFEGYASKFGEQDDGGDIVVKGAYADTVDQFVRNGFIARNHDWDALPIGTIAEAKEDDIGLFIRVEYHSTAEAQAARAVAMERIARGKSVGLSIGYSVPKDGAEVTPTARLLKKIDLFETSQVNVPMLRSAGLTAVKQHEWITIDQQKLGEATANIIANALGTARSGSIPTEQKQAASGSDDVLTYRGSVETIETKQAASGSYEALIEQLSAAFMERTASPFADRWSYIIATYADAFIACMHTYDGDEPTTYWRVTYTQNADGSVTLGEPEQMEQTYTPVSDTDKGLTYADHAGRVLASVRTFTERNKSLADLRRKEGRAISTARRNQLAALRDSLRTGADDLDGLLVETAPPEKGTSVDALRLRSEFDRMTARIARQFGEVA